MSTSDKKIQGKARSISVALALTMLLAGLTLALVALRLGPPIGDLTRISGLAERHYGWRNTFQKYEQDHFRKLLLETLISDGSQEGIVVFGDSFTDAELDHTSWINSLHEHTGQPIDFVEYSTLTDVTDLLTSPTFQTAPPKAIILEMAERTAFRRAKPLMDNANCAVPRPPRKLAPTAKNLNQVPFTRRDNFNSFDELMSWGALALRRRVFASSKTVVLDLNRDDLFTSVESDKLLIYHSDIMRHEKSALYPLSVESAQKGIICALRHVINMASEDTEVYVLVAPDKRSIYAPWTTNILPAKAIEILDFLPGTLNGRYIDAYDSLRRSVEKGTKDVYFPNDTHWSVATAREIGSIVSQIVTNKP